MSSRRFIRLLYECTASPAVRRGAGRHWTSAPTNNSFQMRLDRGTNAENEVRCVTDPDSVVIFLMGMRIHDVM